MDNLENLANLVSKILLYDDVENQVSGTGFHVEVPEVNIPEFTGAYSKDEILSVMDDPENAVAKQN